MKLTIDSDVLDKEGVTMEEFSVLLYYLVGGRGTLNDVLCNILWEKNFLIKVEEGYIINNNILSTIETWISLSSVTENKKHHLLKLAEDMRSIFPAGKKPGTDYYWRDSTKVIAQRLSIFINKYGDEYSDEQILEATRKYVESFNGNYKFMHLLKYFISKKNLETKEDSSELLSYLENAGQEETLNDNWLTDMR